MSVSPTNASTLSPPVLKNDDAKRPVPVENQEAKLNVQKKRELENQFKQTLRTYHLMLEMFSDMPSYVQLSKPAWDRLNIFAENNPEFKSRMPHAYRAYAPELKAEFEHRAALFQILENPTQVPPAPRKSKCLHYCIIS